MRDYETLLVNESNDGVVTITMNRPNHLNALTNKMGEELNDLYGKLAKSAPRVVILTGTGRAFCAGADLASEMFQGATQEEIGAYVGASMARAFNPMQLAFNVLPCPTIARVNGVAAGAGASMALLADIVIAAESANFIFPFVPRLGLVPDLGATWLLPRLVGYARARAITLLGEPVSAAAAERWGMIWRAVPDADLDATVASIAAKLAATPPSAIHWAKALLDVSLDSTLGTVTEIEREAQTTLASTPYLAEGIAAFTEKRIPDFRKMS